MDALKTSIVSINSLKFYHGDKSLIKKSCTKLYQLPKLIWFVSCVPTMQL